MKFSSFLITFLLSYFYQFNIGYGWAHFYIGAVFIADDTYCEFGSHCDPFVEIYINDEKVFNSTVLIDVVHYESYGEMFHSDKKLSKTDSKLQIRVMNHDSEPHIIFQSEIFDLSNHMSGVVKVENRYGYPHCFFYSGYWTDEYLYK